MKRDMKRASKVAILISLLVMALISIRPSGASPLASPLPCPPDVTLPGSVCWMPSPDAKDVGVKSARVWRVWLPAMWR